MSPSSPSKQTTIVAAIRRHLRIGKKPVAISTADESLVWDTPNPFGPPDPDQAHLRTLIQQEIDRHRRFESIGPLDDDGEDEDEDEDDEDYDDEDCDDDYDGDDDDDGEDEDNLAPIALPRLLPIPLRFHSMDTLPRPPPPSPAPSSDESAPWSDLAKAYNDVAEAEERARKAKRDAYRSRCKALAILGPEASVAL